MHTQQPQFPPVYLARWENEGGSLSPAHHGAFGRRTQARSHRPRARGLIRTLLPRLAGRLPARLSRPLRSVAASRRIIMMIGLSALLLMLLVAAQT